MAVGKRAKGNKGRKQVKGGWEGQKGRRKGRHRAVISKCRQNSVKGCGRESERGRGSGGFDASKRAKEQGGGKTVMLQKSEKVSSTCGRVAARASPPFSYSAREGGSA